MAERTPDEIMAEYLLKRGKMLSRTCPECGSPLFDYKGEVFCVVCRERGRENEVAEKDEIALKKHLDFSAAAGPDECELVGDELEALILELCRRVRAERDARECLVLMECIEKGVCALQTLRSPV